MATDPVLGSDDHGLEGLHLASHELGHVHGLVAVLALQVEQRWSCVVMARHRCRLFGVFESKVVLKSACWRHSTSNRHRFDVAIVFFLTGGAHCAHVHSTHSTHIVHMSGAVPF